MKPLIWTYAGLAPDISKLESWTQMGRTVNIIIKDISHIFASICKNMHILLMGRRYRERWTYVFRYIHTCEERKQAQHKSLHVFTHTRSRSRDGAGGKICFARNALVQHPIFGVRLETVPQSYFCPQRHGISTRGAPPSTRLCVIMPAVVEQEYQNPPVSTSQLTPCMCEHTFT